MKKSRSLIPVFAIALCAIVLVFYFIFTQISGVNAISKDWQDIKQKNLTNAISLAEVERGFGYVGFIHHFKNYIIRGDQHYYKLALASHQKTTEALSTFKQHLHLSEQEQGHIQTLELTLADYADKLNIAKAYTGERQVNSLDKLVRIDDGPAEHALNELRAKILPRVELERAHLNEKVGEFQHGTLLIGLCLVPLLLLVTFLTVRTVRQQLANVNELTAIFNASPDGIIYVDGKGNIAKANDTARKLFGYSHKEFLRLKVEDLIAPKLRHAHVDLRQHFMLQEQTRYMAQKNSRVSGIKKDGSSIELSVAISAKKLGDEIVGICLIKDMTMLNTLQQHSDSDHLTSLSNRRRFDYVLEKELHRAARTQRAASLLMIDLDHFKTLNDRFGHLEGDKALKDTAEFLLAHSRDCDYLARWGGDEFVIFCPELGSEEALQFAERLRQHFSCGTINSDYALSLSIGIASTDLLVSTDATSFLQAADQAVYAAKAAGKNCVKHAKDLSVKVAHS